MLWLGDRSATTERIVNEGECPLKFLVEGLMDCLKPRHANNVYNKKSHIRLRRCEGCSGRLGLTTPPRTTSFHKTPNASPIACKFGIAAAFESPDKSLNFLNLLWVPARVPARVPVAVEVVEGTAPEGIAALAIVHILLITMGSTMPTIIITLGATLDGLGEAMGHIILLD